MQLGELYRLLNKKLYGIYPANELSWMHRHLASSVCGLQFENTIACGQHHASSSQIDLYTAHVAELAQGKPLQYVLGFTEFLGCRISVKPGVLIPRPETEEIAQRAIVYIGRSAAKVIDIGTGSGCIAIAIAQHCPGAQLAACDISEAALEVAAANAAACRARVAFTVSDITDKLSWPAADGLDLVISNPPYVCTSEKEMMRPNVLEHEPWLALFAPDADALHFYRHIADFAAQRLAKGGRIMLEINERYGRQVAHLLASKGFSNTEVIQDLSGKDRCVEALLL
jgi:release factor glutamine methyltransferase